MGAAFIISSSMKCDDSEESGLVNKFNFVVVVLL